MTKPIEAIDLRILSTLQKNARLTNAELADEVGLSASACWRRTRQLERSGVIRGYQAVLDRKLLGLSVMGYVSVRIDSHSERDARQFAKSVAAYPEVVACHSVAGAFDFMLVVTATDLDAYEEFAMKRLRKLPGIKEITTSIVLKEIKAGMAIPVPY